MPRRSPKKQPTAPPRTVKPVVIPEPIPTSTQGLSGKIFGLLKKFPMTISSPNKENASQGPRSDEFSESDLNEEDDAEEDYDQDLSQSEHSKTSFMESESDDLLGEDQCRAILENYLLETTTRTNLLRNRIQTQFRPALRRRLEFELSRITPSIAQVTAFEYHQRDHGILRKTMEHVAKLSVEQKGYQIGMKRDLSREELNHQKRKRVIKNTGSTSSKASSIQFSNQAGNRSAEELSGIPPSNKSLRRSNRSQSRSKPPRSLASNPQYEELDYVDDTSSQLPPTPVMSESKPIRLARRNESLISANGSPVISSHHPPQGNSGQVHVFGSGQHQQHEFTFIKTSKWKELEDQLRQLQVNDQERKKIDQMLNSLQMS